MITPAEGAPKAIARKRTSGSVSSLRNNTRSGAERFAFPAEAPRCDRFARVARRYPNMWSTGCSIAWRKHDR